MRGTTPRTGRLVGRWPLLTNFAAASPAVRLLVLTQLAFNVGFFMVLPYLSVYLSDDLGLRAAFVGAVLGLRTFSQQGLFFVGGSLADRWGVKPVVITGCVCRILGFAGLAVFTSVPGILLATVLIGFAGALFSPAVESALAGAAGSAEDGGLSRTDAFALFSVGGQVGACTGPLVGSLLLMVDFAVACLVGAGVFVAILAAHLRWLPATPGAHAGESWLDGWREVFANKRFLVFAVAMSSQLVAYNQMYLLLPLEIERAWGSQAPLGWFFALSSVFVIVAQLAVTRRARTVAALPLGLTVTAAAFVVPALLAPARLHGVPGLLPSAAFVLLLALGQMIVLPVSRDLVPRIAGERRLGSYFGFLASIGGLGVLVGSVVTGALIDLLPSTGWGSAAPWFAIAVALLGSALVLRRGQW
ncbi:MFS transporter [Nocardia goodfellowii]|uniref:MFS family permease n=1 Tax=Nocardia goodfellowii TaxID=882446 RepID=A0ABS4QNI5_9NOCA|nr:MFS transporter [Nocardia goodfellowii]MBP2193270.1 MFS family permease [Nocardia goodfellowii]